MSDIAQHLAVSHKVDIEDLDWETARKIGLTKQEVDRIALVAPEADINIIKGYAVTKKFSVEIPDIIEGIIKCANPNCITNKEKVRTKFHVLGRAPLKVRCHYCERLEGKENIELA